MVRKQVKKPRRSVLNKNINKNIININITGDMLSKKRKRSNKKKIKVNRQQPVNDSLQGYRELSIRKWRNFGERNNTAGYINSMDAEMLKKYVNNEILKLKDDNTQKQLKDLRQDLNNQYVQLQNRIDQGYNFLTSPINNREVRGVIKNDMYPIYGDPSGYLTYKQNEGVINSENMLDDGGDFSFEGDISEFMYPDEPTGNRKDARDTVEMKGFDEPEISEEGMKLYNDLKLGTFTRSDIHNMKKDILVDVMNYASLIEGEDIDYSSYNVKNIKRMVKEKFAMNLRK